MRYRRFSDFRQCLARLKPELAVGWAHFLRRRYEYDMDKYGGT